ncbi:MAG: O-antigen ligase family protein [Thermoleophilaceae bacterium]
MGIGPVELTLSRLLILLGLAALLLTEGARGELFRTRLEIPLVLLLVAGLVTTVKWGTEPRYRFLVESVALFYLAFAVARARPDGRRALVAVALVAMALSALAGIAQISQGEATGFYRDGCEPVTAPPPVIPGGTITRATGTFSNPNLLAGHLLLLAPLGAVAVAGLGAGFQLRLVMGLAVGLGYAGLALTYSRSAIFFGLAALGVAAVVSGMRHKWAIAGVGAALAIGSTFLFAACGSEAGAGYGRTQEWKDTVTIATDNPVYGIGLGRVGDALRANDPRANTRHAHNLFLNWWAEAGPLALIAWIWILGALLWRSLRASLRGDPLARAALVALVGFTGFSLLDHPANVDRVAIAFWIVAALAAAVTAGARDPVRTTSSGP